MKKAVMLMLIGLMSLLYSSQIAYGNLEVKKMYTSSSNYDEVVIMSGKTYKCIRWTSSDGPKFIECTYYSNKENSSDAIKVGESERFEIIKSYIYKDGQYDFRSNGSGKSGKIAIN